LGHCCAFCSLRQPTLNFQTHWRRARILESTYLPYLELAAIIVILYTGVKHKKAVNMKRNMSQLAAIIKKHALKFEL
jgi:glutamine synthetase